VFLGLGEENMKNNKESKLNLFKKFVFISCCFILYFLRLLEGKSQPHKIDGGDQGKTKGKVGVSFISS
jgi:hypothetical protein